MNKVIISSYIVGVIAIISLFSLKNKPKPEMKTNDITPPDPYAHFKYIDMDECVSRIMTELSLKTKNVEKYIIIKNYVLKYIKARNLKNMCEFLHSIEDDDTYYNDVERLLRG